jgi:dolichol-phosphate mannosyltransferase
LSVDPDIYWHARKGRRVTDPQTTSPAPTPGSELGKVLVIIPTYNEADNVERIIERVRNSTPEVHILIADDNSPDGTGAIADRLAEADSHVKVLHRRGKEGLGAAYIAGFRWGMERGYDVLVEMDADGSHQPEELPRLLGALPGADLVIGSRWVPGGKLVNWPKSREALSRGASLYSRIALGVKIRDVTAGYRAFRRATLEGIDLDDVLSQGYCFQIDLAWRSVKRGFRVVEVPITFVEREHGASKMSQRIVMEAWWRVLTWGVSSRISGGKQAPAARRSAAPAAGGTVGAEPTSADDEEAEAGSPSRPSVSR